MPNKKRRTAAAVCAAVLAVSAVFACAAGKYPLSLFDIADIILGKKTGIAANVFLKIRLPRVVFSAIAGMILSVSGHAYRELFSNPLASPDVLGTSSGAGVGTAAALVLGMSSYAVGAMSMAGAAAATAFTVMLAFLMGKTKPEILILSGIAVKALCDALLMALKYMADPNGQLAALEYRLMGTFQNVRTEHIIEIIPTAAVSLAVLYALRWRIRVLALGDDEAKSLGIPPNAVRIVCIVFAALPVAKTVSVTGVISWVGLIVPHFVSMLVPGDFKDNFLLTLLCGGIFMIWTDTAARTLTDAEIPISILTSLAGAVFLLAVLAVRRRKGADIE